MDDKKHQTGKRFQIVVLKVKRNKDGSIKELIALQNHFKKDNEYYSLLNSFYGSPTSALEKTIEWYLDSAQLAHPVKTLYKINKSFLNKKLVSTEDVANMGLYSEFEDIILGLRMFFTGKKKEELVKNGTKA